MNLQESKSSLQTLAEKHCTAIHKYGNSKDYQFTLDQLRALIREVAGEPIAVWDGVDEEYYTVGDAIVKHEKPLYAIPKEILE